MYFDPSFSKFPPPETNRTPFCTFPVKLRHHRFFLASISMYVLKKNFYSVTCKFNNAIFSFFKCMLCVLYSSPKISILPLLSKTTIFFPCSFMYYLLVFKAKHLVYKTEVTVFIRWLVFFSFFNLLLSEIFTHQKIRYYFILFIEKLYLFQVIYQFRIMQNTKVLPTSIIHFP